MANVVLPHFAVWEWEVKENVWGLFDLRSIDYVESLYQIWLKEPSLHCHEVSIHPFDYKIDFQSSTQVNTATGRCRAIRKTTINFSYCWLWESGSFRSRYEEDISKALETSYLTNKEPIEWNGYVLNTGTFLQTNKATGTVKKLSRISRSCIKKDNTNYHHWKSMQLIGHIEICHYFNYIRPKDKNNNSILKSLEIVPKKRQKLEDGKFIDPLRFKRDDLCIFCLEPFINCTTLTEDGPNVDINNKFLQQQQDFEAETAFLQRSSEKACSPPSTSSHVMLPESSTSGAILLQHPDTTISLSKTNDDSQRRTHHATVVISDESSDDDNSVEEMTVEEANFVFQNASSFNDDLCKLQCDHYFHYKCMTSYLKSGQGANVKCPVCCRHIIQSDDGYGPSPTGSLSIVCPTFTYTIEDSHLPGHEDFQIIILRYVMPSGVQTRNQNENQRYSGTTRVAYLPDSPEGREVLNLFIQAFVHGYTFTVGESITSGRTNVVIWNGLHHKTSMAGGISQYGYPDDTYFNRVIDELSLKGIRTRCAALDLVLWSNNE